MFCLDGSVSIFERNGTIVDYCTLSLMFLPTQALVLPNGWGILERVVKPARSVVVASNDRDDFHTVEGCLRPVSTFVYLVPALVFMHGNGRYFPENHSLLIFNDDCLWVVGCIGICVKFDDC